MVAGFVFLAQHRDVVVRAVHGRAHQVGGAGVDTDILFIDMLFVQHRRHQRAVGRQHVAAHLGKQRHIPHPGRDKDLLKLAAHALADLGDVVAALVGAVGDAHAARQVDELDLGAGALVQAHRQAEQDARQLGVVFVGDGVAGQERMDAELLGPQRHQFGVGLGHLVLAHAVFGIAGVVHDAVAQIERTARVVAAAHGLGNARNAAQELDVRQVVEVDVRPQLIRLAHILRGRIVGGKHDLAAGEAAGFAHQQFGIARAVDAAAFLPQDLQDIRVGRGFYGEVFFEALVPGERRVDTAGVFADGGFVVQVKRRGHVGGDGFGLFQRDERQFLRHIWFLSGFPL